MGQESEPPPASLQHGDDVAVPPHLMMWISTFAEHLCNEKLDTASHYSASVEEYQPLAAITHLLTLTFTTLKRKL